MTGLRASLGRGLAVLAASVLLMAGAPDPADMLKNPAQEARARSLFKEIRCIVCQNESIDDSEAELAHDMRQIVRGQVKAGRTDAEIRAYFRERYGDYILLRPRLTPGNALLWGGPFLIVLLAGGFLILRRRTPATEKPLSPNEVKALKQLQKDMESVPPA